MHTTTTTATKRVKKKRYKFSDEAKKQLVEGASTHIVDRQPCLVKTSLSARSTCVHAVDTKSWSSIPLYPYLHMCTNLISTLFYIRM